MFASATQGGHNENNILYKCSRTSNQLQMITTITISVLMAVFQVNLG